MIKAIALTGPTASGKTGISIEVARALSAEIISLDSMQIYRKMDIGTAKVSEKEARGIPHHMIDILSPKELFSAEDYKTLAMEAARAIRERGNIPFFVGGTGLYLDTLIRRGSSAVPKSDRSFTDSLKASVKTEEDREALWQKLYALDPEEAEKVHKNNLKRLIRAYEICVSTGKKKSELDKLANEKNPEFEVFHVTLDFHNRDNLYRRVDKRVDEMMKAGLLRETEELYREGFLEEDSTAFGAIGYKELLPVILGKADIKDAVEEIKLSTRRYAKRQLTWFRHTDAVRVMLDTELGEMRDLSSVISEILNIYREKM